MKTNAQRNHEEENINIISRFLKALAPLSNNGDDAELPAGYIYTYVSVTHNKMPSSSSQLIMASSSATQPWDDLTRYLPLHRAILGGNLELVKGLCGSDEHALEARITVNLDTALHVAVGRGIGNHIVEYLLNKMSRDQVALKNSDGNTALSVAAIVGNIRAADLLVKKDVNLNRVANNCGWIPLIQAAQHKQEKMIKYLLQFNEDLFSSEGYCSTDAVCIFLNFVIGAEFFDLALELVKRHPNLSTKMSSNGESLLKAMAGRPSAFPSGIKQQLWQHLFFPNHQEEKHWKTLELVRYLCIEITNRLDHTKASFLLKEPLLLAAELGIIEVVKEIIKSFPDAVLFSNEMNYNALQLAVMNRQEKVFNLVFETSSHRNLLLMSKDIYSNNVLHLAGKLAPEYKLNLIPGEAMQMKHELHWFKEIEKLVHPYFKEDKNFEGKTPAMVFSEEHKELVKKGEKWMKSAATSSSGAAALIATIAFAAAMTIPGNYNDEGRPNFNKQTTFLMFGVSDTISMFSSLAAIIMFLSIFTSRYAQEDFLQALPRKLIQCLTLSSFSVTSTMVAFACAAYLVFFGENSYGLVLVAVSLCLPIFLFASAQYPLLVYLLVSTYGPGIFRKQNKHVVY